MLTVAVLVWWKSAYVEQAFGQAKAQKPVTTHGDGDSIADDMDIACKDSGDESEGDRDD